MDSRRQTPPGNPNGARSLFRSAIALNLLFLGLGAAYVFGERPSGSRAPAPGLAPAPSLTGASDAAGLLRESTTRPESDPQSLSYGFARVREAHAAQDGLRAAADLEPVAWQAALLAELPQGEAGDALRLYLRVTWLGEAAEADLARPTALRRLALHPVEVREGALRAVQRLESDLASAGASMDSQERASWRRDALDARFELLRAALAVDSSPQGRAALIGQLALDLNREGEARRRAHAEILARDEDPDREWDLTVQAARAEPDPEARERLLQAYAMKYPAQSNRLKELE